MCSTFVAIEISRGVKFVNIQILTFRKIYLKAECYLI